MAEKKMWTPEETHYLMDNFSKTNIHILCKHLGRSKGAVYAKSYAMRKKERQNLEAQWESERKNQDKSYKTQYGMQIKMHTIEEYFENSRPPMWDSRINDWRLNVFNKDSYTCQLCGSNKKLHAHHLDSWHWCIEGRYNVNNGVTLCSSCHKHYHQRHGRTNNTKEQFENYRIRKEKDNA